MKLKASLEYLKAETASEAGSEDSENTLRRLGTETPGIAIKIQPGPIPVEVLFVSPRFKFLNIGNRYSIKLH